MVVAFALKVGVTLCLGLIDGFGYIHLAYVEVVLVVPVAALGVLLAHRFGPRRRPPAGFTRWPAIGSTSAGESAWSAVKRLAFA